MSKLVSWIWTDENKDGNPSGTIATERILFIILVLYILAMIVFTFVKIPNVIINIELGRFISYAWLMAKGAYLGKRVNENFGRRQNSGNDMLAQMFKNAGGANRGLRTDQTDNVGTQDPEEGVRGQRL